MRTWIGTFALLFVFLKETSSSEFYIPMIVKAYQSGTMFNKGPELAIDKDIYTCSFARADSPTSHAWWRVELDQTYLIAKIYLANTPNTTIAKVLCGLKVFISRDEKKFERHVCASARSRVYGGGTLNLTCTVPIYGKYVTIKRSVGVRKDLLAICEFIIEVQKEWDSRSFKQPTSQSGALFAETSPLAVDGNISTCTKVRAKKDEFAWWRVTLEDISDVTRVAIYFNPRSPAAPTMTHFTVFVSSEENDYQQKICDSFSNMSLTEAGWINLTCTSSVSGMYITIKRFRGIRPNTLFLCEVYIGGHGKTNRTCEDKQTRCEILSSCLPKEQICDRITHCPDGSDELNCTCLWLEYQCRNGPCINKEWLCDGVRDCPYGDDEEAKSCVSCKKGQFKCVKDNTCIYIRKRCDGITDCHDQSDERGCLGLSNGNSTGDFLKATFKGDSDYYVCSSNWGDKFSLHACQEMGFNIYEETRFTEANTSKIIALKSNLNQSILEEMLPFMTIFEKRLCKPKKFVELVCPRLTDLECGVRGFSDDELGPYIVTGSKARHGAWPWHVQIIHGNAVICGGSLIHKKWVLTAAHCLEKIMGDIYIKLGTVIANDPLVKNHTISHFMLHPNFNPENRENDIAMIKLNISIRMTSSIRTVCLPGSIASLKELMSFRYCIVTGFGKIADGQGYSRYLLHGKMNIMNYKKCADNLQNITGISSDTVYNLLKSKKILCGGSPLTNYGINICKGDSGGPLVCKNDFGRWIQLGVASHSHAKVAGHARDCEDSIFTRIDQYLSFIKAQFHN